MTIHELIDQLRQVESAHGPDLLVVVSAVNLGIFGEESTAWTSAKLVKAGCHLA